MQSNSSRSSSARTSVAVPAGSPDRRRRARLRDLCDEVLASFRMARQPDQFTAEDRATGKQLVAMIAGRTL